ncbi:hypothetical protein [Kribbella endophytica]
MPPRARRTDPAGVRLPADLTGPVEVELAKLVGAIPAESALPGGSRYDVKWDGYLH